MLIKKNITEIKTKLLLLIVFFYDPLNALFHYRHIYELDNEIYTNKLQYMN
jgi:hypothetical protein